MSKFKLRELIDGYETSDGEDFVGRRFFRREITGSLTVSASRKRKSKLNRFIERLNNLIGYTNIKTYGFLLLTFGLLTVMLYFASAYIRALAPWLPITDEISLIIGALAAIISIPLMLLDGPMSQTMQEYIITDIIFFDFLCIKRMPPIDEERAPDAVRAVTLGVILSLLGLFVPTKWIVGVGLLLVYFYLSMGSPEFSLFSTILILPYHSIGAPEGYGVLATLVVITVISFARKLIYGKRVLNIEQYDILITVMLLMVVVSGIFNGGIDSFESSIKYISLSFVYILAGNIITNKRLADCAVNAIIFSSAAPALQSIGELIYKLSTGAAEGLYYDGISSVFFTREIAAAHFAVSLAMAVSVAIQMKGLVRAGYITIAAVIFVGLILTFEPFAYIAVLLAVMAYLAFRRGRRANLWLIPLALVPYLIVLFVPDDFMLKVFGPGTDGLLPGEIKNLWLASLKIWADNAENAIIGIGVGSESFLAKTAGGIFEGISNSHNLFIEIAVEAGVISLIAFVFALVVRIRHRVIYQKYIERCDVKPISDFAASAIFVMLMLGATVYIWQDLSLYYLFWCVFGVGSATLRIAKQEYDDRVLYSKMMSYQHSSGHEMASVDVRVVDKK